MRLDKNTIKSLNDTVNEIVNPKPEVEETEPEIIHEEGERGIADMDDAEAADYIIRYNQVVNAALRARHMSRTRRKSV